MRYAVILCDGMADYKMEALNQKTPMMVAEKPNMNNLAKFATQGLAVTLYDDLPQGSDIANLSVLGYNSRECYTGRSPIEALGLNIPLSDNDTVFRLNLVTLSEEDEFCNKRILDHSGGKITNDEAYALMDALRDELTTDEMKLFNGVSYRHILIWKNINYDYIMTPPHDILGKNIKNYLPQGKYKDTILSMMERSYDILMNHPVNQKRLSKGLEPANCIWLWGEGTKPKLNSFYDKYQVTGSVITAVPLIQGIARGIGLDVINVPGATGDYDTNYAGKGVAASDAIKNGAEFLFVHIEAPDECGHDGDLEHKIKSIEHIDREIVSRVVKSLEETNEPYKILIMPDHATPIVKRTHTTDPVPFLIYDSENLKQNSPVFDEDSAKTSGIFYKDAFNIMSDFINK